MRTIEFTDRARNLTVTTVRAEKRRARVLIGFGVFFVACALVALVEFVLTLSTALDWEMLFGTVFLAFSTVVFLSNGIPLRARYRNRTDEVLDLTPYAFRITESTLEFPDFAGRAAESWPLSGTTASMGRLLSAKAIVLRHPDFQTYRFLLRVLADEPEQVIAAVEDAQRRCSEDAVIQAERIEGRPEDSQLELGQ